MSALTDAFTAIANKIRSKLGVETTYTPAEMPAGIEAVYAAGAASAVPSFSVGVTSKIASDGNNRYISFLKGKHLLIIAYPAANSYIADPTFRSGTGTITTLIEANGINSCASNTPSLGAAWTIGVYLVDSSNSTGKTVALNIGSTDITSYKVSAQSTLGIAIKIE